MRIEQQTERGGRMYRGNIVPDECMQELRAFALHEEIKQKKDIAKQEVYNMSKDELRRALLKYKYADIEGCLLSGDLTGLKDY